MFLFFVSILFILFSCGIEVKQSPYTAKEQLDYINNNLNFIDDSIKIGKAVPEIKTRDDFDELSFVEYDKYDRYNIPTLYYSSYKNKESADTYSPIDHGFQIRFDGHINMMADEEYLITYLNFSTDNCSFFDVHVGESIEPIVNNLKDRGFYCKPYFSVYSYYKYGFISIFLEANQDKKLKNVIIEIKRDSQSCIDEINDFFTTNRLEYSNENFIKYLVPIDKLVNYSILINKIYYMDDHSIKFRKIIFDCKYSSDYICGTSVDTSVSDTLLGKLFDLIIKYYVDIDYSLISKSYRTDLQTEKSYFENIDYRNIDILIMEGLSLHQEGWSSQMNFTGISEEFLYIKEAIESDPRYERYLWEHNINHN